MTLMDLPCVTGKRPREVEESAENVKKIHLENVSAEKTISVEMVVGELQDKSRVKDSDYSSPFRILEQEPWNPYATIAILALGNPKVSSNLISTKIKLTAYSSAW